MRLCTLGSTMDSLVARRPRLTLPHALAEFLRISLQYVLRLQSTQPSLSGQRPSRDDPPDLVHLTRGILFVGCTYVEVSGPRKPVNLQTG